MVERTTCPRCGECPFVNGVCEEKISRGRRFFMLGALALPVAAQIARVAAVIAPPPPEYTIMFGPGSIQVGDHLWMWTGREPEQTGYVVTKINSNHNFTVRKG